MPLIYITGISGSGKSAVCKELKRRGYKALDTDKDGIAFFYNKKTDEPVTERVASEDRTPRWRAEHVWRARHETIEKLAGSAQGKTVFLCGVTSNDKDELWGLFSQVFALHIDANTLKHRIASRTGNDFGKNPHELSDLLRWQQTAENDYTEFGAILIDATQPVSKVADQILNKIKG